MSLSLRDGTGQKSTPVVSSLHELDGPRAASPAAVPDGIIRKLRRTATVAHCTCTCTSTAANLARSGVPSAPSPSRALLPAVTAVSRDVRWANVSHPAQRPRLQSYDCAKRQYSTSRSSMAAKCTRPVAKRKS
ncbi:hypothetical protein ZWY2020_055655 [Hordeum vulgare]|nr:hypothetical protein ZWY2020_055655 [Hordeum vulgare]